MDQYEKFNGYHKMDSVKKRIPDYTDIAYREAVARLRYLLAESYSSRGTPTKLSHTHSTKIEDSGDETDASAVVSDRSRHVSYRAPIFETKYSVYPGLAVKSCSQLHGPPTQLPATRGTASVASGDEPTSKASATQPPPELMAYIERQEEYIEQLEKESQYCREELSNLIGRVKDVISENEGLHEKEKSGLLKSVFESFESGEDEDDDDADTSDEKKEKKKMQPAKKKRLEGPSIVFESRISELEAQLTQTKIDLRKALEEVDMYKKKLADVQSHSYDGSSIPNIETYKHQIEILQREKEELKDNMAKLNMAVAQIREKEADATHKAKRTLDVADQAEFEKAQAEMEVRRLKEELDRQHEKLRDLLQEQGRKVQEERAAAERRYAQQVEQLSSDLAMQWDAVGKLQLELERERRIEADLRRELQQKNCAIEELKKELHTKIGLQSEASQNAAERGSLEQELTSSRLMIERAEREARQEAARLQAEITALRQRLDRADGDLLHSRRENLRLSEQVASLERELNLAKMAKESATRDAGIRSSPSKQSGGREKELSSMIMDMEAKHVKTVAELEGMIQSQNLVMEKLREECHSLTKKLEDSSARHKEEKTALKGENVNLLGKLEQVWKNYKELQKENIKLSASDELSAEKEIQATHLERSKMKQETGDLKQDSMIHNKAMKNKSSTLPTNSMSNQKNMVTKQNSSSSSMKNSNLYNISRSSSSRINNNSNSIQNTEHTNLHMSKTQASSSLDHHLLLSPWRREVAVPPLTLEDLATDSDSCGSQSAQLDIFK